MKKMTASHLLDVSFAKSLPIEGTGRSFILETLDIPDCGIIPDYLVPEDSFTSLPDWSEALFAVGNIVVLIFSLCGNIGALFVLFKSETSKRSTKVYLTSLSICDLILTLTSPTVDLSQLLSRYQGWIFGKILCKIIPFIQTAAVMGVALFLVAIAAERYFYVVRAFDAQEPTKKIMPSIIVFGVWLFSLGISVPNLWYYERKSFWTYLDLQDNVPIRPRNETCKMYYTCLRTTFDMRNIAYYSVLGVAIIIPSLCFLFCYVSIIIFVRRHATSMVGGNESRLVRNRKTLRLILTLIAINLVCRLPVWAFVVYTNLKETASTTTTMFLFYAFHLLSNINSMLNPCIYAIFNDSIRSTRNNAGNNATRFNNNERSSSPSSFTSYICKLFGNCFSNDKISSSSMIGVDYFLEKRRKNKNSYDFTKSTNNTINNSKFVASISTQKFNMSEKNEVGTLSPITEPPEISIPL